MAKAHTTENRTDPLYRINLSSRVVDGINRLLGILFILFIVAPLAVRKWYLDAKSLVD